MPVGNPWEPAGRNPRVDVARYVMDTTSDSDTVLMWGIETTVNFLAGRRSPTRFVFQHPLYRPIDYPAAGMVEEFLAGIKAARPALIIDTSSNDPNVPPLDAAARQERVRESDEFVVSPELEAAFSYIAEHYQRVEMPSSLGWVAYRYAGGP